MTDREEKLKLVQEAVRVLAEHFDAVQVMVSWQVDDTTDSIMRGRGNWYARAGMAHELINQDKALDNAIQIAKQLKKEDDK